jgi:hypothetical protein
MRETRFFREMEQNDLIEKKKELKIWKKENKQELNFLYCNFIEKYYPINYKEFVHLIIESNERSKGGIYRNNRRRLF